MSATSTQVPHHHHNEAINLTTKSKIIGRKSASGTYKKAFFRQGYIYKNSTNFYDRKGICYVPELSEQEYTYQDFLDLCGGNSQLAKYVFETIDWQHPESLVVYPNH